MLVEAQRLQVGDGDQPNVLGYFLRGGHFA